MTCPIQHSNKKGHTCRCSRWRYVSGPPLAPCYVASLAPCRVPAAVPGRSCALRAGLPLVLCQSRNVWQCDIIFTDSHFLLPSLLPVCACATRSGQRATQLCPCGRSSKPAGPGPRIGTLTLVSLQPTQGLGPTNCSPRGYLTSCLTLPPSKRTCRFSSALVLLLCLLLVCWASTRQAVKGGCVELRWPVQTHGQQV